MAIGHDAGQLGQSPKRYTRILQSQLGAESKARLGRLFLLGDRLRRADLPGPSPAAQQPYRGELLGSRSSFDVDEQRDGLGGVERDPSVRAVVDGAFDEVMRGDAIDLGAELASLDGDGRASSRADGWSRRGSPGARSERPADRSLLASLAARLRSEQRSSDVGSAVGSRGRSRRASDLSARPARASSGGDIEAAGLEPSAARSRQDERRAHAPYEPRFFEDEELEYDDARATADSDESLRGRRSSGRRQSAASLIAPRSRSQSSRGRSPAVTRGRSRGRTEPAPRSRAESAARMRPSRSRAEPAAPPRRPLGRRHAQPPPPRAAHARPAPRAASARAGAPQHAKAPRYPSMTRVPSVRADDPVAYTYRPHRARAPLTPGPRSRLGRAPDDDDGRPQWVPAGRAGSRSPRPSSSRGVSPQPTGGRHHRASAGADHAHCAWHRSHSALQAQWIDGDSCEICIERGVDMVPTLLAR